MSNPDGIPADIGVGAGAACRLCLLSSDAGIGTAFGTSIGTSIAFGTSIDAASAAASLGNSTFSFSPDDCNERAMAS